MRGLFPCNFRKDPEMSTDKNTAVIFSSQQNAIQKKDAPQTSSSDYAVMHTSTTVQRRALPALAPKLASSSQTVTQTLSSDYTAGHQTIPGHILSSTKPLSATVTSTLSSDYPVSHSDFAQKPTPFSGFSGTVTQTLASDYPVSHSHLAPKVPTKPILESIKTKKKEKAKEDIEFTDEEDDIEDAETLNPFLGARRLPGNAITVGKLLGEGAFGQVYRGEWGTRIGGIKKD